MKEADPANTSGLEFGQKFGIALLMVIPTLLGSVFLVDVVGWWMPAIIWIALMPVVYWAIITGKIFGPKQA